MADIRITITRETLQKAAPVRRERVASPLPVADATDKDLLNRVGWNQDERAFGELIARYTRELTVFANRGLGGADWALAEDVVQETFARLWERAPMYAGTRPDLSSCIRTLVYSICQREIWAAITNERRTASLNTEVEGKIVAHDNVEDFVVDRWVERHLREKVASLSDLCRSVFELTYWGGMTIPEAADHLGRPYGGVRDLARRARVDLENMLTEDFRPPARAIPFGRRLCAEPGCHRLAKRSSTRGTFGRRVLHKFCTPHQVRANRKDPDAGLDPKLGRPLGKQYVLSQRPFVQVAHSGRSREVNA